MTSKLLPNGLSRRTNRCLALAGIPINKPAIIRALKSGKFYRFHWPPNYGQFTHFEGIQPANPSVSGRCR